MDFLPLLIALGATGLWIAIAQAARRQTRAALGSDVREIRLHRRWARWAQTALLGAAILLPVFTALEWRARPSADAGDLVRELMHSFWMLSVTLGIGLQGRLLAGSRGIAIGNDTIVPWADIVSASWDRDIGQRQWGLTLVIRHGRVTRRQRLYVVRQIKPEVEQLLATHRPGDATTQAREHAPA